MSTNLTFRNVLNLPVWRQESPPPVVSTTGSCMTFDLRNGVARDPLIYAFGFSSSVLDIYNPTTKGWLRYSVFTGQTATAAAGNAMVFHGGQGPKGLLASVTSASVFALDQLLTNAGPVTSCSRSATVLTVNQVAHGLQVGDYVSVASSSDTSAVTLGMKAVATVPNANSYTFTCLNAGSTTPTLDVGREVAAHQLSNRGADKGYFIRIISTATGKTAVGRIAGNTAGCSPTITLEEALPFTPSVGDKFEILAGRVFMLNGGTAGTSTWRYYDVATGFFGWSLSSTNLPVIGTDSNMIALAECHVPYDRDCSEGFFGSALTHDGLKCVQATATASTTITGSGMPAELKADEYRNFQVRIVEDLTTPTSVGQRRRITSHTSGASGVFTVPAWTVTPSADAKFVVENDNDRILLRTNTTSVIYTYNITANAWSTTDFAAPPAANAAGVMLEQAFAMPYDPTGGTRHSYVYNFRGGGGAYSILDRLDIAGASNGVWKADLTYAGRSMTTTAAVSANTGAGLAYDTSTNGGRFAYMMLGNTNYTYRFNFYSLTLEPWAGLMCINTAAAIAGSRLAIAQYQDGATKLPFLYINPTSLAIMHSALIQPNSPSVA